jgi:thiamine-phosphate pyrophosphorylase
VGLADEPRNRATALFVAGVDWIQLRDRRLADEPLLALTRALVSARDAARNESGGRSLRVIVNRRLDVALAARADGVHLGFDAVTPPDARRLLGDSALIGGSLHTLAEVTSEARGALLSYAHLAPVWDPISKPATREALGAEALARACRSGLPLLAQGGIDPARAAEAVAAGAAGVAVTGSLRANRDPTSEALRLRRALDARAD